MEAETQIDSRAQLEQKALVFGLVPDGNREESVIVVDFGGSYTFAIKQEVACLDSLLEIADTLSGYGLSRRNKGKISLGEQLREFVIRSDSLKDNTKIILIKHPDSFRREDIDELELLGIEKLKEILSEQESFRDSISTALLTVETAERKIGYMSQQRKSLEQSLGLLINLLIMKGSFDQAYIQLDLLLQKNPHSEVARGILVSIRDRDLEIPERFNHIK